MCGIFGFLTRRPSDDGARALSIAADSLRHRGPDDSGSFSDRLGASTCGLASTRLAVVDLTSAGKQPMMSSSGRYAMVYNGEISNHRELRRDLGERGVGFRSLSDTEVVLEAFAEWGPHSVERLRGMFAFAIWDRKLGELFLARDRLGIKPLYFTTAGPTDIAFASETRTLIATGMVAPKLSRASVESYLQWGSVAEPQTIFENVEALSPGTYMFCKEGRSTRHRYWRPDLTSVPHLSFEGAVEQIAPLIEESVNQSTIADVPVSVLLSGGMDSAGITALATRTLKRLSTFTLVADASAPNEARRAEQTARHCGTEHHEVHVETDDINVDLINAVGALDQPSADGINTYLIARSLRQAGVSVALSGLGADELFAGYHHFRNFKIAQRLAGILPRRWGDPLDRCLASNSLRIMPNKAGKLAALFTADRDPLSTYAALRGMFTPAQTRWLVADSSLSRQHEASEDWEPWKHESDAINAYAMLELTHYVRDTLLRDADCMGMAHGVEMRVPFLDHRLVELTLSIPGHLKVSGGANKPLLAAALPAPPAGLTSTEKVGFVLPWDAWLRGPMRAQIDVWLSKEALEKCGLTSSEGARALWTSFLSGDRRITASRVWCIAALSAFCERNKVTA